VDDITELLTGVALDVRNDPKLRTQATELLRMWQGGVIPPMNKIRKIRRAVTRGPDVCGRLGPDRACGWLAKNAKKVGLKRPQPGQKAFCHRKSTGIIESTYQGCPGFRRLK
jgi:hypothetical protein